MALSTQELVKYETLISEFKKRLGLGCLHIYEADELIPYYIIMLNYFVSDFVVNDYTFEQAVDKLIQRYDEGQEFILTDTLTQMYQEYNVGTGFTVKDIHWVDAWVELVKTTYLSLMFNYSYLFTEVETDCHECACERDDGTYVLPESEPKGSEYVRKCGCQK